MNLSKIVSFKYWHSDTDKIGRVDVSLETVIQNPTGYNMADLGFYLLNEIREDLGLPGLHKNCLSGSEEQHEKT